MTTPSGDTRWLETVRKLLAKAEDPACPPAEAEALTAKAAEIVAKYGIDQALLNANRAENRAKPEIKRIMIYGPSYTYEKATMLGRIAEVLGCRAVLHAYGRNADSVSLVGFAADIERAEILYTSLLIQQANALTQEYIPYSGNRAAAWKRSWMDAYSGAVAMRLRSAERRAQQGAEAERGPGTDLVFVGRADEVRQMYEDEFTDLTKRRRQLTGDGRRAGYAAGARANLGGTGVTSSTPNRSLSGRR
ncbi:MAG TPA: DUF2786 domain-containing protein [Kofleriaceae bacterium]